jgi:CheY-like chemotaxis protein
LRKSQFVFDAGVRQSMSNAERANILLVDDQPARLLTYEAILADLGQNLIKAGSGREALQRRQHA